MSATTNKIIIDVKGMDNNGDETIHSFRLPSTDDWQKNLISLNKKIIKKFNLHNGYALSIKHNIIAYNDHKAVANIINNSTSNKLPLFQIVDKSLLHHYPTPKTNHKERRKVIIHSFNKQYTFSLPLDITESDDNIYTQLITEIKQRFKINNEPFKLYEKCNTKNIEIDDWDDLYESLEDKKLSQSLHLYIKFIASHNSKVSRSKSDGFKQESDGNDLSTSPIYQNHIYIASRDETGNDEIFTDRTAKVVLLGDSGVGKSSIEQRFVWNRFSEWREPTVGAMFSRRTLDYGNYRFTFEIWDTAGQDRFRTLTPLYYRNATAALIVYDITSYQSFDNALKWIQELHEFDEDIVIGLCGNKLDLYKERKVTYKKVKDWVVKNNIAVFGETSAKTDVNITQLFRKLGDVIVKTTKNKEKSGFHIGDTYDGEEYVGGYDDSWCYCQIV